LGQVPLSCVMFPQAPRCLGCRLGKGNEGVPEEPAGPRKKWDHLRGERAQVRSEVRGAMGFRLMRLATTWRTWLLTGVLALFLAAGVGFQFVYVLREVPQATPRVRIADSVARALDGWVVSEELLGTTEAVSEAALKVLNLDDYVYRRFRRGNLSFTVYAAYWAPGRMPTRLVASHTPDRCWTENGMRCIDLRFKESYEVKSRALLPAEYRVFVPGGMMPEAGGQRPEDRGRKSVAADRSDSTASPSTGPRTYVVYWHTVEGKLYDYGERFNAVPHPWLWWKDTLAQAAYGSREQLFVRVASETPLESLWREPGFQTVMESVAQLGLYR
jgi:hypothetical protein